MMIYWYKSFGSFIMVNIKSREYLDVIKPVVLN